MFPVSSQVHKAPDVFHSRSVAQKTWCMYIICVYLIFIYIYIFVRIICILDIFKRMDRDASRMNKDTFLQVSYKLKCKDWSTCQPLFRIFWRAFNGQGFDRNRSQAVGTMSYDARSGPATCSEIWSALWSAKCWLWSTKVQKSPPHKTLPWWLSSSANKHWEPCWRLEKARTCWKNVPIHSKDLKSVDNLGTLGTAKNHCQAAHTWFPWPQ